MKCKFTIFTYFLRLIVFKPKNNCKYTYVFLFKDKNYIIFFRFYKKNNFFYKNNFFLSLNCFTNNIIQLLIFENLVNRLVKQFLLYNIQKIKFLGKGYKIKKISTNMFNFIFNRAHKTFLFFKNNIFKKIKKKKIHLKFSSQKLSTNLLTTIKNIRLINHYTRRGLRLSRLLIYKRKGKQV